MSPDPTLRAADSPVIDDETDAVYSIEVVAELAGVDAGTKLTLEMTDGTLAVTSDGEAPAKPRPAPQRHRATPVPEQGKLL